MRPSSTKQPLKGKSLFKRIRKIFRRFRCWIGKHPQPVKGVERQYLYRICPSCDLFVRNTSLVDETDRD